MNNKLILKIINIFLLLSFFSSIFSNVIQIQGLTIVFIAISFFYYIIFKMFNLKKLDKFTIIIYINIIFIFFSLITNTFNFESIRNIMYYTSIIMIYDALEIRNFEKAIKLLNIIVFFISIYVIIKGIDYYNVYWDLYSVRNVFKIEKQSFNIIYTIILPLNIYSAYKKKNFKNILILVINLIASLGVLQIKSIIFSLFFGFIIINTLLGKIKIKKIILYGIIFLSIIFVVYKLNIINQLTPIVDYIIYGEDSKYIGSKYLDTYLIRAKLINLGLSNIINSVKIFFGIGYGNFNILAEGQLYYRQASGNYIELPTATESAFLTFFIEGGLFGLIVNLILIILIFKEINKIKKFEGFSYIIILITSALIVSNIMQDNNTSLIYWFILGACIRTIFNKEIITDI